MANRSDAPPSITPRNADFASVDIATPDDQSYSAWTQAFSATDRETIAVIISAKAALRNGSPGSTLIKIAVGGSGSEVDLFDGHEFFAFQNGTAAQAALNVSVPIRIPIGSRVSIKAKADSGSSGTGSGTSPASIRLTLLQI